MGRGTNNVIRLLLGGGEYCFNCILSICFYQKPVVHGHGQGKRLGTCLVLEPCAFCVVSCSMCQCLILLVAHGYGRGMHLDTCLVYATCVMAIVACVTGDGLYCLKSLHSNKQHTRAI